MDGGHGHQQQQQQLPSLSTPKFLFDLDDTFLRLQEQFSASRSSHIHLQSRVSALESENAQLRRVAAGASELRKENAELRREIGEVRREKEELRRLLEEREADLKDTEAFLSVMTGTKRV